MIVQGDIAKILYKDCKQFGLPVYQKYNTPTGKVTQERIVVIPKSGTVETYWEKCFVEVNFCVPDKKGKANLIRMDELEREAVKALKYGSGMYDGTRYKYKKESTSREEDMELGCHFVNVRLLFKILNAE